MSSAAHAHAHHAAASAASLLRHRKNVELLRADQLAPLRQGFAAMMAISDKAVIDNRGYQYFAGLHGLPQQYCQHSNPPGSDPLFLPWHRAYLYFFELALRDQVGAATLAWWDWTSPGSHASGIPAAFAEAQAGGQANPLYKASVQPAAQQNGQPKETYRAPGDPGELPTAEQVRQILSLRSFSDFTAQLEDVHNAVHGWAGGTMGVIPWAAYDPIFWAHHTNIDRLWRIWQLRHPQNFAPSFLSRALPPFPLTVAQTLNMKTLATTTPRQPAGFPEPMPERYLSPPLELPGHDPEADFVRAELQFHGVDHSGLSYEARVYLNRPESDASTPREEANDGGYAGSFHIFGHGGCFGDVSHCDVPSGPREPHDLRLPHPLTPDTKTVIITEPLRRLRASRQAKTFTLTVVAHVYDPGELPLGRDQAEPLLFDSVSLLTYEAPSPLPPVSAAEAERPAPEPV